jgi:hypothetical protein
MWRERGCSQCAQGSLAHTAGELKTDRSKINILRNKNTSIVKILLSSEFLHSVAYILTFYDLSTPLERLCHPPGHKLQQVPKVCISPTLKQKGCQCNISWQRIIKFNQHDL